MNVVALAPERVVQTGVGNSLCISAGVWSFKVENERNMFEINGRIRINESNGNRLLKTCKDWSIIGVSNPFQSSEDGF